VDTHGIERDYIGFAGFGGTANALGHLLVEVDVGECELLGFSWFGEGGMLGRGWCGYLHLLVLLHRLLSRMLGGTCHRPNILLEAQLGVALHIIGVPQEVSKEHVLVFL
jgi:hypothetical protein